VADGSDASTEHAVTLLSNDSLAEGRYEVQKGVFIDVLERRGIKTHRNFRGSLPHSNGVEESFPTGPIFAIYAEDAIADIEAGLTLIGGRPVRETAVVTKLTDRYRAPSSDEIAEAEAIAPAHLVLPLASQRMRNYCRWWLDSVAKLYICNVSTLVRMQTRGRMLDVTIPKLEVGFHRQTVRLPGWKRTMSRGSVRYMRGPVVNSPGLTFGGGQRIGASVAGFSQFLDLAVPQVDVEGGEVRTSPLLYITRSESGMRRIVNEEELLPGLRDIGFNIVNPSEIPLSEQIAHFRAAKVVLSAHGAGLTNILFCRPGTTLIEIFPEGGVHGSAFLRIASHLDFDYYFVVGTRIETSAGRANPNNSDLSVEKEPFLAFVREAVDASR
jgi:hypothetical protein